MLILSSGCVFSSWRLCARFSFFPGLLVQEDLTQSRKAAKKSRKKLNRSFGLVRTSQLPCLGLVSLRTDRMGYSSAIAPPHPTAEHAEIGRRLANLPLFPAKVNVNRLAV
jgi:hypothetical protein